MRHSVPAEETDQDFVANGIRLYAHVWHASTLQKRPLVILHGLWESWRTFAGLGPRFAEGRAVYALDLRGHGDSDKPETGYTLRDYATDVLELIPQISQGKVDLLGHSLGSLVAMYAARSDQDAFAHLILEDPPLIRPDNEPQGMEIFWLTQMLKHRPLPDVITALTPIFGRYPPGWVERFAQDLIRTSDGAFPELVDATKEPVDLEEALSSIRVPTLVLAPDPAGNFGWFKGDRRALFEKAWPSARIVDFPVDVHHLNILAPDLYLQVVEEFLATR